ncbi:MAG: hypothetical protein ACLPVO_11500 [Desulfomonilaceae bacterium]
MPKKPSKNKFGAVIKKERYVTHKELAEALEALKESILSQQKGQLSLPQDAPRPRVFHKKKDGKREKLATTIDANLFELVKQKQQAGQQLSHILDSALWNYFGHPKLSFE